MVIVIVYLIMKFIGVEVNSSDNVIDCYLEEIYYGDFFVVCNSQVFIKKGGIIGFIGLFGCGKSIVLCSFNCMNDLIFSFWLKGIVIYYGSDIYVKGVDLVLVWRYIGMVF